MKFKIKNYKVFLFIFIFISAVCFVSSFSVCASKSGEAESEIDLTLKEDEKSDKKDLMTTSNKSKKEPSDDLLDDIAENISEDSFPNE